MTAKTTRRKESSERRTLTAAFALILGVLAVTYYAFGHPTVGSKYDIHAVVSSANQLRSGSPVRIAGVDVGQIRGVEDGPGNTATITMRISGDGQPLHRDATLKIRPRLFLEGGFYVDLKAGSPSSPKLKSGATLPLSQTAVPVQLNDLLSGFDSPTRASLRDTVRELDTAVSNGGATSLRRTARQLGPLLRDFAWVSKAAEGTQPHDVSQLVSSASKVTGALTKGHGDLAGLVANLDRTASALTADDGALGGTVEALDRLLKVSPGALSGLDATLPVLDQFARAIEPGLHGSPAALSRISSAVTQLAALVEPQERERVLKALSTTFEDLPTLVSRLAGLFPVTQPLTECLSTHITPILNSTVPDGTLSTGRPVWQDFAHTLVGLSGVSQNFDANGYSLRYDAGIGAAGFSTEAIPGLGQIFALAPPALQSRPVWLGRGVKPAFRPDAPCADQPLPALTSATRSVNLRSAGRAAKAPRITPTMLRRLTDPVRLRKLLGRSG